MTHSDGQVLANQEGLVLLDFVGLILVDSLLGLDFQLLDLNVLLGVLLFPGQVIVLVELDLYAALVGR